MFLEKSPFIVSSSGVASPKFSWGKSFDFKRATVFCKQ